MRFDPQKRYHLVAHHSELCIECTPEFGVLQNSLPNPLNGRQLWTIRELEHGCFLISLYKSQWVLTHHGFFEGPISLSPRHADPSDWQRWELVTPAQYYGNQVPVFPSDCYLLLTGLTVNDRRRNHHGEFDSCLDVLGAHGNRPGLLCEYPVQPAGQIAGNQIFQIMEIY